MDEIVLTFHCAAAEADAIAQCLRAETRLPIHVRQEAVHGRDFSDAKVGEQVTGMLMRAAVAAVRRAHPVRWMAVPVVAHGRIA